MKIILLQDIKSLGKKGDIKDVASGYAQNFLLPNKMATATTKTSVQSLQMHQGRVLQRKKVDTEKLLRALKNIPALTLHPSKNDEGRLFAAIKKEDILKILSSHGVDIDKKSIALVRPIKELGEYSIPILIENKKVTLSLEVS